MLKQGSFACVRACVRVCLRACVCLCVCVWGGVGGWVGCIYKKSRWTNLRACWKVWGGTGPPGSKELSSINYDMGREIARGETLIFSAYVGSGPASTVHPIKISGIPSTPKKYLKF